MTIKSFYKPTPQLDAANLVIDFQITNVRRGFFLKIHSVMPSVIREGGNSVPPPPTCAVSGGSVFVGGDYSLTTFSSNVTPLSVATRMM